MSSYLGIDPKIGANLGKDLGSKLSRIIGSGDYVIGNPTSVNALISASTQSGDVNASFQSRNDGVRIRHREYIQDIVTGAAGVFSNISLPVNPGLAQVMPYLASIAQNFEEYKYNGLVFEFVSSTSPYNSSSAMGTAVMAMEYNPGAQPFTNKQQMENSDYAVSARFDKNMMYGVECATFYQNNYLVRYQSASPIQAYDCGLFQFAVAPASTFPAGSVIGELWVSYDVTLTRPRISPARYGYAHVRYTGTSGSTFSGSSVVLSAIGTLSGTTVVDVANSLPIVTISDVINGDVLSVTGSVTFASAGNNQLVLASATGTSAVTLIGSPVFNSSSMSPATVSQNTCCINWVSVSTNTGSNIAFHHSGSFSSGQGAMVYDLIVVDLGNGYVSGSI